MIRGIESFKKKFKNFENQYVLIGGSACDILMTNAGLNFRATKDLDIVIIIENLSSEFGIQFWEYIKEANYEFISKDTNKAKFYRFQKPKNEEYPSMIELFSKGKNLNIPSSILTKIHIDENISSLSAIILDEEYYNFILNGTTKIDGISILDPVHIIPLKMRAYVDLFEKRNSGENISSTDIKKHKNDVYRLSMLLTPNTHIIVSKKIHEDILKFIELIENDDINLSQIGIQGTTLKDIITVLINTYQN